VRLARHRVTHIGRHHHRLVGRRHRRIVGDVVNRRAGIGDIGAVGHSRAAQIVRHRQRLPWPPASCRSNAATASGQPCSQRASKLRVAVCSRRQRVGVQSHLAGIVPRPELVTGTDVQGITALITRAFQTGTRHAPLERPVVRAAFKRAIGNVIDCRWCPPLRCCPPDIRHVQQADLGVINRRIVIGAVVQHAGAGDVRPDRLGGVITVRPVGRQPVIGMRDQSVPDCCRRRRTIRPSVRPCHSHLVFLHHKSYWCHKAFRLGQRHQFAVVRELCRCSCPRCFPLFRFGYLANRLVMFFGHHQIAVRGECVSWGNVNVTPEVNCQPARLTCSCPCCKARCIGRRHCR
jgi:hypothetical protein